MGADAIRPQKRGPFPRVKVNAVLKQAMLTGLRDDIDRSGWRTTMRIAAHLVLDHVEKYGVRFEMRCRELGDALGMSVSTGGYYLRRLRESGLLQRYRKHYIDWEKTEYIREVSENPDAIVCAPAVHQLSLRRSRAVLRKASGNREGPGFLAEVQALTWDDPLPEPPW